MPDSGNRIRERSEFELEGSLPINSLEGMEMTQLGSTAFWLEPHAPGWLTDTADHRFPSPSHDDVGVTIAKFGSGTVVVDVILGDRTVTFNVAASEISPSKARRRPPHHLHVGVSWTPKLMKLYLNGERVEQRRL